jgi:NAD kinase
MSTPFSVNSNSKFFLLEDAFNQARAESLYAAIKAKLPLTSNPSQADCFIVIGGDGSLLQAVRHPERNGRPILALNGGTVGKTLVDTDDIDALISKLLDGKCFVMQFPVIDIVVEGVCGEVRTYHAFNDVWADRLGARSVRYSLNFVGGDEAPYDLSHGDSLISGDGLLASTPVGSTGYARMLGDMVLPLNTKTIMIAPMASMVEKRKVHAFLINEDQSLLVRFEDYDYRPVRFAVDGVYIEDEKGHFCIKSMKLNMMSHPESAISLVVLDRNSFMKKQVDFIAR